MPYTNGPGESGRRVPDRAVVLARESGLLRPGDFGGRVARG
jgi:hypothetical protein